MNYVITRDSVVKARNLIANGWVQGTGNKTATVGYPWDTPKFTILAALQRAAGVRLYSSNKGGWFVSKNYEKFNNRKSIDALAVDYAAKNPATFTRGPVLGIETLNNFTNSKQTVIDFLNYVAGRVDGSGTVNMNGVKVKKA